MVGEELTEWHNPCAAYQRSRRGLVDWPLRGETGGTCNNEDLRFRLAVKPPPPLSHEIRVLCSAVEDENSFDRHAVAVLKDGKSCWPRYMLQNITGSLAARLRPPATMAG